MTSRLLILRPADSADTTAGLATDRGFEVITDPLFELVSLAWEAPDPAAFDALMITSANVLRYGGTQLDRLRALPVLAVGDKSAAAAAAWGFTVALTGTGGAQQLIDGVSASKYRHILRLTGKHYTSVKADQIEISLCRCYEAKSLPLGANAIAAIRESCLILLHSTRAATALQDEMKRLDLHRSSSAIAALSPQIADAAGTGWADIAVAAEPTDDALLDAAGRLCLDRK